MRSGLHGRGPWWRLRIWTVALPVIAACISCGCLTPGWPGHGAKPSAANPLGGCAMCHVDVVDDLTGTQHYARGIGCIRCHGPSEAHAADENNEVRPDRLPARNDIDSFCGSCHKCSRPKAAAAVAGAPAKVCTECHGTHKLRPPGGSRTIPSKPTGA